MLKFLVLCLFVWQANATLTIIDGKPFIHVDSGDFPLDLIELTPHAEERLRSTTLAEEIALYKSTLSPQIYDLKPRMSSVKSQGARRTCSVFQAAALVEQYLGSSFDLSEQCLVYLSTSADTGDPFARLKFALSNGLHYENHCPYVDPRNYTEWVGADERAREQLIEKAKSTIPDLTNREVATISAQLVTRNIEEMASTSIINYTRNKIISGLPVGASTFVVGKGWDKGLIDKTPSDKEIAEMCPTTISADSPKKKCTAHAIVVTGFDDSRGVFYFKNSWRESWGVNASYQSENAREKRIGYGVMPYEYLAKFVVGRLLTLE